MIKINLLPIRQLKKRAKAQSQIVATVIGLVFLAAIMGTVSYFQINKVTVRKQNISQLESKKKEYAPILAQMKKIEQQKKELQRRTAVIDKLKKDSSLTVRVLDEVANIVDNDRLWLLSLNQQGGSLQLSGVALDNQTVAEFMDNLKLSPFVNRVDLTDSSLRKIAGRDLKSFSLRCAVAQPKKQAETVAKAE